jgi:hypothetical protein
LNSLNKLADFLVPPLNLLFSKGDSFTINIFIESEPFPQEFLIMSIGGNLDGDNRSKIMFPHHFIGNILNLTFQVGCFLVDQDEQVKIRILFSLASNPRTKGNHSLYMGNDFG